MMSPHGATRCQRGQYLILHPFAFAERGGRRPALSSPKQQRKGRRGFAPQLAQQAAEKNRRGHRTALHEIDHGRAMKIIGSIGEKMRGTRGARRRCAIPRVTRRSVRRVLDRDVPRTGAVVIGAVVREGSVVPDRRVSLGQRAAPGARGGFGVGRRAGSGRSATAAAERPFAGRQQRKNHSIPDHSNPSLLIKAGRIRSMMVVVHFRVAGALFRQQS